MGCFSSKPRSASHATPGQGPTASETSQDNPAEGSSSSPSKVQTQLLSGAVPIVSKTEGTIGQQASATSVRQAGSTDSDSNGTSIANLLPTDACARSHSGSGLLESVTTAAPKIGDCLELDQSASVQTLWKAAEDRYRKKFQRNDAQLLQISNLDQLSHKLSEEEDKFVEFRNKRRWATKTATAVLTPLVALSDVVSGAVSLSPWAPASAVLSSVLFLFKAADNVTKKYDDIIALFGQLQSYIVCLAQYIDHITESLKEKTVHILACFLEIMGDAEQAVEEGRMMEYLKNMFSTDPTLPAGQELATLLKEEHSLLIASVFGKTSHMAQTIDILGESIERARFEELFGILPDSPDRAGTSLLRRSAGRQKTVFDKVTGDTRLRLLREVHLLKWLSTRRGSLLCHGIAGAGKSTLAVILVKHLTQGLSTTDAALGFLFCHHLNNDTLSTILATLAVQLSRQLPMKDPVISEFMKDHENQTREPSREEYFDFLKKLLARFSKVYLVIDSFDELLPKDSTRKRVLARLQTLQEEADVRLLVTTRSIDNILDDFGNMPRMVLQANMKDIKEFLHAQHDQYPDFMQRDPGMLQRVDNGIATGIGGMFLLAPLYVKSFSCMSGPEQVQDALTSLRTQSRSPEELLDEAYKDAVARIDAQPKSKSALTRYVIAWIVCAQRSLTAPELCHAVAIHDQLDGTASESTLRRRLKDISHGYLPRIQDLLAGCDGLVVVDENSGIVRTLHSTTHDFFRKVSREWQPKPHTSITLTSLAQLSLEFFDTYPTHNGIHQRELAKKYPLLEYASQYLGYHAGLVQDNPEIDAMGKEFLQTPALRATTMAMIAYTVHGARDDRALRPHGDNEFHVAAWYGLARWLQQSSAILDVMTIQARNSRFRTPLSYAAQNGHAEMVKLFLDLPDMDANPKDDFEQTPLIFAAMGGHLDVVRLLLHRPEVRNDRERLTITALEWAAKLGHIAVVQALLNARMPEPDGGDQALHMAAQEGHDKIVGLLLNQGRRDPNRGDYCDTSDELTPLMVAAKYGHAEVVRTLLKQRSIDLEAFDSRENTALMHAAMNNELEVVRLIAEYGESKDLDVLYPMNETQRTPLLVAAEAGHHLIVQYLLDIYNSEVNAQADWCDVDARTPLSHAAGEGRLSVVLLLIGREDVIADSTDKALQSPLWWASDSGHREIVQLLLQRTDVEPNRRNRNGVSPLSQAAYRGHMSVVELLLENDNVDIQSQDKHLWTPIVWAVRGGHIGTVWALLNSGRKDVVSIPGGVQTLLRFAEQMNNQHLLPLLEEYEKTLAGTS